MHDEWGCDEFDQRRRLRAMVVVGSIFFYVLLVAYTRDAVRARVQQYWQPLSGAGGTIGELKTSRFSLCRF